MSTAAERFEAIMMSVHSIDCLTLASIPYELVFKIQKNVVLGMLEEMNTKIEALEYDDFWNDFYDDGEMRDEIELLEEITRLLVDLHDTSGARFVEPGDFIGRYNLYAFAYDGLDWWNY